MQIKIKKSTLKNFGIVLVIIIGIAFLFILSGKENTKSTEDATVSSFTSITASEFKNEIQENGAVILDIRTPAEYSTGRIKGAINIDYYSAKFRNELSKLDKSKEYKIYCNSGNRSSSALQIMKELGFNNVVELTGGIQAWNGAGLSTCTEC